MQYRHRVRSKIPATQAVSRFSQQFIRLNGHNRSSRLRRIIIMHRGDLKDHVRLED